MNLAFFKNKLKNIVLHIALFTPFFISGCDYSQENRLKIENIQSNNSEYPKKYEGKVERFYYRTFKHNFNSFNTAKSQFIDSKGNNIPFYTEIYLDNGGFYVLDGKMNIKNGDEIYSFKADVNREKVKIMGNYAIDRNFFCTKDNNCLIDFYLGN